MLEMQKLFLVGIGGSVGAMLRYFVFRLFFAFEIRGAIPYHTLLINLVGCFLIGLLATIFPDIENNQITRLFLLTGILGGFTTYSAFGLEIDELIRGGSLLAAATYVSISIIVGLLAVAAGISLGKSF